MIERKYFGKRESKMVRECDRERSKFKMLVCEREKGRCIMCGSDSIVFENYRGIKTVYYRRKTVYT